MKKSHIIIIIGLSVTLTFTLTMLWDVYRGADHESSIMEEDHDDHAGEEDHDEEAPVVALSPEELKEFDAAIETAGPGLLTIHRDLAGEIVADPDRLAHIGPRFPGIVKEVRKKLGQRVKQGEVLAIVESNESMTPYEIRSLIDGTIIEMHLTEGEMISGDNDHAFLIADLSEVWANLTVYQKDLPYIKIGQTAEITMGPGLPPARGTISYISPVLDEHTRTATARVVLPNPDGEWRPGLFVTSVVEIDTRTVDILVPRTALETYKGQTIVFVETDDRFRPQPVKIRRSSRTAVEIIDGLRAGQNYVVRNGFTLKAELEKDSFSGGHAH